MFLKRPLQNSINLRPSLETLEQLSQHVGTDLVASDRATARVDSCASSHSISVYLVWYAKWLHGPTFCGKPFQALLVVSTLFGPVSC